MAENGEKRSPTSHRTPSQYKRHYKEYQGKPQQLANRSNRNKARRILAKEGLVSKGDGKDVGHVRPMSKGGTTTRENLRVQSRKTNRGHGMSPGGNKK
jgi:hypothetical protein